MERNNKMFDSKKITIGILADVDAGKTTLSEALLFTSNTIRKAGRVDHRNTFLDIEKQERKRGITIFSKQAKFSIGDTDITLLDTPGHTYFSAETERTLAVLDYAVLVVSAVDGVKGPIRTLWHLLDKYNVPVFVFINKTDMITADINKTLESLHKECSEHILMFDNIDETFYEKAAMCDEALLESYIEKSIISDKEMALAILQRKIFPCFSGSALKMTGTDKFINGLSKYTLKKKYPEEFGAKVYKITRDEKGIRLTHMKITGGKLSVREAIRGEKVTQIRLYNGKRFDSVDMVRSGIICAVAGLENTYSGQGLGFEEDAKTPVLETVLKYRVITQAGTDIHMLLKKLERLNEELPELHIEWNGEKEEINVSMMGDMQKEILKGIVKERFHTEIEFSSENIIYKETIKNKIEGVGHFEPLKHYAEVHLIMTPLKRGEGLKFDSECSEDEFDKNWQRLVMTHLLEKKHKGVLTGSALTDVKISIAAGKAHTKHTEGGDFRQATYRAVRQGLKKADSVLLEPYYDFRLEIPENFVGRAMNDIDRMYGKHDIPVVEKGKAVLSGKAPVSTMNGYHREVLSYTGGEGSLFCVPGGYFPCHNQEEVILEFGYDSEKDSDNPSGSIFCINGAGIYIPWNKVEEYMHLQSVLKKSKKEKDKSRKPSTHKNYSDEELEEIFKRTYKTNNKKKKLKNESKIIIAGKYRDCNMIKKKNIHNNSNAVSVLIVDGYNMIFSWDELNQLSKIDLSAAREKLMEILHNYQGYTGKEIILVFDAYRREGNCPLTEKIKGITVVFTKKDQTADQYIERYVFDNIKKKRITVATSDNLEQTIIFGQGALRMPASELRERIKAVENKIRENYIGKKL